MVHEQDYPFLVDSIVLVSESSLCVMFSYIHLEKKKPCCLILIQILKFEYFQIFKSIFRY